MEREKCLIQAGPLRRRQESPPLKDLMTSVNGHGKEACVKEVE